MAEPLHYSFGKGCDFAKKSCKEYIQLKRNALVLLVKTVYIFTPIVTLCIQYIRVRFYFVIIKILRITITIIKTIVNCSKIEIRSKNQTYFKRLVETCHVSICHLQILTKHRCHVKQLRFSTQIVNDYPGRALEVPPPSDNA